jgi:hypothetical protein
MCCCWCCGPSSCVLRCCVLLSCLRERVTNLTETSAVQFPCEVTCGTFFVCVFVSARCIAVTRRPIFKSRSNIRRLWCVSSPHNTWASLRARSPVIRGKITPSCRCSLLMKHAKKALLKQHRKDRWNLFWLPFLLLSQTILPSQCPSQESTVQRCRKRHLRPSRQQTWRESFIFCRMPLGSLRPTSTPRDIVTTANRLS